MWRHQASKPADKAIIMMKVTWKVFHIWAQSNLHGILNLGFLFFVVIVVKSKQILISFESSKFLSTKFLINFLPLGGCSNFQKWGASFSRHFKSTAKGTHWPMTRHTRANDKDHRHVAGQRNGVEKSKPGLPLEQIEPKKIKKIVSFWIFIL